MKGVNSKICVSICTGDEKTQKELLTKYDFCEIRTDLCKLSATSLSNLLKINSNVIVTIKDTTSDSNDLNWSFDLIRCSLENGVSFIDIDIDSNLRKQAISLIKKEKSNHTKIILSYHNYDSTPPIDFLKSKIDECKKEGADFIKITTLANSYEDATRVLQLYQIEIENKGNLIAFCMGEIGRFTRISSILLGAGWGYAKGGKNIPEAAPGQFDYEEFKNYLYPKRKYHIPIIDDIESINIDPSKSISQRAILIGGLSKNLSVELSPYSKCDDSLQALDFIKKLAPHKVIRENEASLYIEDYHSDINTTINEKDNIINTDIDKNSERDSDVKINFSNNRQIFSGINKTIQDFENEKDICFNAKESALLARCLIAYCAVNDKRYIIDGTGSLLKRDFSSSADIIKNNGGSCSDFFLPIQVTKGIEINRLKIVSNTTSQDVTGYLIAFAAKNEGGEIEVTDTVSTGYINLTINLLKSFGFTIKQRNNSQKVIYTILKNEELEKGDKEISYKIDKDWSSAANILVACAIKSYKNGGETIKIPLELSDINNISCQQPDKQILNILLQCGVEIKSCSDDKHCYLTTNELKGFNYDATNTPDLIPILIVLASFCSGESRIKGVKRLFNKESNRADAMLIEMHRASVNMYIQEDYFVIRMPQEKNKAISFSSHNDHRIAMAMIILNQFTDNNENTIWIDNIECINKSFPSFYKKLLSLELKGNIKP